MELAIVTLIVAGAAVVLLLAAVRRLRGSAGPQGCQCSGGACPGCDPLQSREPKP